MTAPPSGAPDTQSGAQQETRRHSLAGREREMEAPRDMRDPPRLRAGGGRRGGQEIIREPRDLKGKRPV